ncbi:Pumilio 12 like [Actinidia chinensis var. chinensis]|uniref:Pumilio 12 like n=1 Tax=Actinidia chinensis var. chinensis TaxID=1590841 RepID=A0A2R6P8Z0_ACTCC|nr:Pumilio 12 like [Actinidia chinensis var. chinensis]
MEKGINELDVDEFEKLLGEIPNVTSGAPNTKESGRMDFSKDLKRVSMDASLTFPSNGTVSEKLKNDGSLDTFKLSVNKILQPHIQTVQQEEPNLPDDQSLSSAFAELSFNEQATTGAARSPFVDFKSFQNHSTLFNGTYPNGFTKRPSNVDSQAMFVPTFQSLNNSSNSVEMFGAKNGFQESSNPFRPNVQEFKKQPVGYHQPIEQFSDSYPITHRVPGYQFFSNMPVQGVELPVFSDQRQYFMDTQSQLPYLHSQLSQPHVTWRPMEEEQYYRMHKQYLYMQQLRNQRLEAQQPIRANGNVVARITSQNLRQPCNESPISNHLELSNQEAVGNKIMVSRNTHLSNYALSSTDFNKMQVLDKVGKQAYPEKILMRSQGLNSLKSVKFGSFVGNELLADVNQSGRVFSNGHYHRSLPDSNAAFHLDSSVSSRGLLPVSHDLKHNSPRPLPQFNSVDEISGRIYFMAKDQHGCRFLQRKFTEGTPEDVEKIFLEIIVHIIELMTDPFGNYLVQKLLEVCNEDQRMQIVRVITRKCGDLVRISCDMHGTRAVQKIIETLKTPAQFSMVVSSLNPGIVTVIKNMNGNHVAQRCLQYLSPEYCEFLFEAAIANCVELATDRHGCCVLQKCLGRSDGEHRRRMICEITSNALILSQDQFGNYVVQFIFENHVPWATIDILDQLEGNYGDLSMQKYSSNVVEKCLKYAGEERQSCIIQELINNPRLDQIMQDPYGNYVIQAALNHSKGTLHAALVDAIRPHVPLLRTSPYGKKVLSSNSLKK